MDKWSQLPGTLKVPGWYHVHRLELAGDCDSILEDPNCTMTGGLNSGLAYPGSQVGRYTRLSEKKGSTFGCQSLKKCLFSEWVAYSTRTKNWNGKKNLLHSCRAPDTSRWHPAVWLTKGGEVWGQFHAGPYSIFCSAPWECCLMCKIYSWSNQGLGSLHQSPPPKPSFTPTAWAVSLPTGLQYCIHSPMQV